MPPFITPHESRPEMRLNRTNMIPTLTVACISLESAKPLPDPIPLKIQFPFSLTKGELYMMTMMGVSGDFISVLGRFIRR